VALAVADACPMDLHTLPQRARHAVPLRSRSCELTLAGDYCWNVAAIRFDDAVRFVLTLYEANKKSSTRMRSEMQVVVRVRLFRPRWFFDSARYVGARHAVPSYARLVSRRRISHRMIVFVDAGATELCVLPQRARHAVPLRPKFYCGGNAGGGFGSLGGWL